jgi:large subunit ribosomal protein L15
MKLNTISPAQGSKTAKKRLGRGIGSGLGKTSGKGHKGQHARAGGYNKRGFEGGQMPLQMRVPKFGFKSRTGFLTEEVRLSSLEKLDGDVVTVESLKEANIVNSNIKFVKIFLHGEISKSLTVKGIRVSAGARAAIENAGGKVEE